MLEHIVENEDSFSVHTRDFNKHRSSESTIASEGISYQLETSCVVLDRDDTLFNESKFRLHQWRFVLNALGGIDGLYEIKVEFILVKEIILNDDLSWEWANIKDVTYWLKTQISVFCLIKVDVLIVD